MVSIGDKFGAWKVRRQLENGKFLCICLCCKDSYQVIKKHDLISKKTKMCKSCSSTSPTLDDLKMKEVRSSYDAMMQRCFNTSCKDYKNYGARGITVHPAWADSFESFYMQVGPRPSADCTLERIDVEESYVPGNVKWLPRKLQPRNQRSNVRLEIDGEEMIVTDWAKSPGCTVSEFTIYKRLNRGWPAKAAVFAPPNTRLSSWKKSHGEEEKKELETEGESRRAGS